MTDLLTPTDTATEAPVVEVVGSQPETLLDIHDANRFLDFNAFDIDLKESKVIQKYVKDNKLDIVELAKGLINVNTLIGKKLSEADAETLKAVNIKLNIPNDKAEYELKAFEGKTDFEDTFKTIAFENKLDKEVAKTVYEKLLEAETQKELQQVEKEKEQIAVQKKVLIDLYGAQLNEKVEAANKALDLFGTKELREFLIASGASNNAEVVKFLSTLGEKHTPKEIIGDMNTLTVRSATDIQKEIDEVMSHPSYLNSAARDHHDFVDKRITLYKQLHGSLRLT